MVFKNLLRAICGTVSASISTVIAAREINRDDEMLSSGSALERERHALAERECEVNHTTENEIDSAAELS